MKKKDKIAHKMQRHLDRARQGLASCYYYNPWKLDYENETWNALDEDGNLWREEGGQAYLAGTP